jgi:flagellin
MIQIQNNTEDGISLLSTAQGGLEEIETLLSRLRELTIQASNGTYDAQSRDAMQIEADAIVAEIERLKNIIEFNGMKLYERPRDNAVASISNATQINSIHSMMFTPQESNSSDLTTYLLSDEENPTSSDTFSLNQPTTSQIESTNSVIQSRAAPMMFSASPASAENIEGAENFSASETRTITIDGVQYTVKNRQSTASTLSYTKDGVTGQVTFMGAYFDITAQSDVTHNICINGSNIYFYGGNEADTITTTDNSQYLYIYGQGGNDTIVGNGLVESLYGGAGDDNITKNNDRISKLEQAKIMRTLFSQNNMFGGSTRYNNPW